MQDNHIVILSALFTQWAGAPPDSVTIIPPAGSNRRYIRFTNRQKTAIGTYGSDLLENRAFLSIGKHLRKKGVNVPEIYLVADDKHYYLQEDLGDLSLFDWLRKQTTADSLPLLEKVVGRLAALQINGAEELDFSDCYPVAAFDKTSILWDLNYFKYCFLKAQDIDIDEVKLERDFEYLVNHLLEADATYFMFRDFQSRNIIVSEDKLGFIDFQGGRKGPLQYDLASFLFQAKARFPEEMRERLLHRYLDAVQTLLPVNREKFIRYYYPFVLFRLLQVLGAYGFRGFVERKPHFLESVPYALQNVRWLLDTGKLIGLHIPYLSGILNYLSSDEQLMSYKPADIPENTLTVEIMSFAYKNGYPEDASGNGGGYVFDCRGLNNPGRVKELRKFTGRDRCIIDFLENNSKVEPFLQSVFAIVTLSLENYIQRDFSHLAVSFGCTGGLHRSVYCAERMAAYIANTYPTVMVKVVHRELAQNVSSNP